MDTKTVELDRVLDVLGSLDRQRLRYEIDNAAAVRRWAMKQAGIDYEPGEKVVLVEAPDTDNGWSHYRDALAVGATATVQSLGFNGTYDYWFATIVLDREFAWNEFLGRHNWHGPVADTPEGMEPPSPFDQENYPEGRRHTFAMPVRLLRRAASDSTASDTNTDPTPDRISPSSTPLTNTE